MTVSTLYEEIQEQPGICQNFQKIENLNIRQIARNLVGKFKYVVIAARGSSDNAARYAQYLLGSHNRIQVALATPSLFSIYKSPPDLSDALIIAISQSGKSPDILSVVEEGHKQGCPTIAITNYPKSPLGQISDYVINLNCNEEKAVAATKTYTASLLALALFSSHLNNDDKLIDQIMKVPNAISDTISLVKNNIHHTERYRYAEHCVVIGRGYNYPTGFEIALKVKELTQVVAVPYSTADFRHGPIATVHKGFPMIIVAPSGMLLDDMFEFTKYLKNLGAELIVISDNEEILDIANLPFKISPDLPEWLSPISAVIPGQLFSMYLALERGLNPDMPEGITKVTETL